MRNRSTASESEFASTVEWLYSLRLFGAKLGLDKVRLLAALVGNPQDQLKFVHVAGTNGKGSTCAMLESIYRQANVRTGLFTSPHLVSFRERIQVDRRMISEADVVRLVQKLQPLLKTFPPEAHPTFFEVVTVLALLYFAEQGCELVIWETGLGGRLDATNIVTPEVSVITNIQLDHQQWLGQTLESIAGEKAGIIKSGVPVVTAAEPGCGLEVIREKAEELQARLVVVDPAKASEFIPTDLQLSLRGRHQLTNAALAIATVETLAHKYRVGQELLKSGLQQVRWEGRLQLAESQSGQRVLLDGAHNPSGAACLAAALETLLPRPRTLIIGLLQDKDGAGICECLAPLADRILTVPIDSERATQAEAVAELCRRANPEAELRVCSSLAEALGLGDPSVVVTGSLHLVGAALEELGLAPVDESGERRLNDYSAQSSAFRLSFFPSVTKPSK